MRIISIANQKGGCGKTITAVNLAASLAKINERVLLIDLDPQAHASFHLNKVGPVNITNILEATINQNNLPQELYSAVSENFYFVPSSIGLASLENKIAGSNNRFNLLSPFLNAVSSHFDYCLIDCPPNLGLITLNALASSNYTTIPVNLCDFSLRGIDILKNILIMLKEFHETLPVPFYLLSQVDKRSKFAQQFIDKTKRQFGSMLLSTQIRTNIHLREAASNGKTIFEYNPESRGAEDFSALAWEIKTLTSQTSWAPLFLKNNDCNEVYVLGDFNNWQREERYRLNKLSCDIWGINLPLEKGRYRYKFLSEKGWFNDPLNQHFEEDPFGGKNSLLVIE